MKQKTETHIRLGTPRGEVTCALHRLPDDATAKTLAAMIEANVPPNVCFPCIERAYEDACRRPEDASLDPIRHRKSLRPVRAARKFAPPAALSRVTFGAVEVTEDEDFSRFSGVGPWFPDEFS